MKKSTRQALLYSLFVPSILMTLYVMVLTFQIHSLSAKKAKLEKNYLALRQEVANILNQSIEDEQEELENVEPNLSEEYLNDEDNNEQSSEDSGSDSTIESQDTTNLYDLQKYIVDKRVSFVGEKVQTLGTVMSVEIRDNRQSNENGVIAVIEWDDGVESSILFLENTRVRAWENRFEYGGNWNWSYEKNLEVQMDEGAKYSFSS